MDNAQVMTALRRRRLGILLGVVTCTGLTFFGSTRMKREYLATATLMPQEQMMEDIRDIARPLEADRERDELAGRQDRLKTVATVLTSPSVLSPVIKAQKLKISPALLQDSIEVKEVTSQVLRVAYKDEDPKRAAGVINSVTDTFINYYTNLRSREATKQVELLEKERGMAERELHQASARLESFKRSENISSLPDQTRDALDRANRLSQDRNAADARMREVAAQIGNLQSELARTPATREIKETATQTKLLEKLRLDVIDLKRELEKELGVHTEEHPKVRQLRTELAEAQRRLDTESNKMDVTVRVVANPDREALVAKVRDLRSEHEGLQARLGDLNAKLSRTQAQVSNYSGKDVQLSMLTQRYTLAEQRLNAAMARLGQLRNATGLLANGTPIAVVDRSGGDNPPIDLSQGRTLRLTALAFVMSLAVCVALSVAMEMGDRRVRSVEDVESLTQLPVVSVVPRLRAGSASLCLKTEDDPSSHLAESYHFLANHVLRQTMHRDNTVLIGATARPGQGATTALCNLAVALARAGRQVVLVEADLRRPYLDQVFGAPSKPGLTDVLQGNASVIEALVPTHVDNLRLLSGGSIVKDPWSLLLQPSMPAAIQMLRESADYVIFNVPSATVFADALCVAPHVDGAILVMRTREMPNGAEQKVRQWLDEVDVPVMGVVLNDVPTREMETANFHRTYTARRGDAPRRALQAPSAPPVRRSA